MVKAPQTRAKQFAEEDDAELREAEARFPRRTAKRQKTRSRIIAVANEQFRRNGFGATTMQSIADAADIHVTTLFLHFKSKNDLAISLTESVMNKLRRMADEAIGKVPFFDFFRDIVVTSAVNFKDESEAVTIWSEVYQDSELAFAWSRYEQAQKDLYADYIAHDYGLDRKTDYLPDLIASLMHASSQIPHQRWVEAPKSRKLLDEVTKSLEISERAGREMLQQAGLTSCV